LFEVRYIGGKIFQQSMKKLPSQSSGSIDWLESYRSWMLITPLLSTWVEYKEFRAGISFEIHWGLCENTGSIAILTQCDS